MGSSWLAYTHFAEDIVNQLNQQLKNNKSDASNEWEAVIKATTRTYEGEITEPEVEDYKDRNNLTETGPEIKSKSGRQPEERLARYYHNYCAYIIKHYRKPKKIR